MDDLQMSMRMGVVFNPEALELFVMKKVFAVETWLKQQNHPKPRLKTADMARMLGFGVGDELFDLIERSTLSILRDEVYKAENGDPIPHRISYRIVQKARLHSSRSLMLLLLMAFSLCCTQFQQTRAGAPAPAT